MSERAFSDGPPVKPSKERKPRKGQVANITEMGELSARLADLIGVEGIYPQSVAGQNRQRMVFVPQGGEAQEIRLPEKLQRQLRYRDAYSFMLGVEWLALKLREAHGEGE